MSEGEACSPPRVSDPSAEVSGTVSNSRLLFWRALVHCSDSSPLPSRRRLIKNIRIRLSHQTLPVQSLPTTEESISPFSDQEITNAVLERVGNNTSMSFTRPTSPEGVGKQPLFLESGDHVTLLWAAGPEDTFGYHFLGRGAFTVDLLCADSQTVVDVNQPFETPDPAIVPTAAGSGLPFTEVPTMSPLDVLLFTVSPTPAPTSPQPPQPADGSNTSGALPGLLQAGGGFIGLHIGFARAMAFGLFAVGVSLCI